MYVGCIFFCADSESDDRILAWQNTLMMLSLADISPIGIQLLSNDHARGDYCDGWYGIHCCGRLVIRISHFRFQHGNFNLSTLPHSVTKILLVQCGQTFKIQTRSLPRELLVLSLGGNKIYGRVDLTTLPPKLKAANLWVNMLKGPIKLTHLPNSLQTLVLYGNKINQDVVWYDNLPDNIRRIHLINSNETNRIGKVRAVTPTKKLKYMIFPGIPRRNVH
ncbi:leucine rich repeat domain protein [Perkinsela sp. CCAP 1560/4]|nr:leucine rich repeat domain protein [Perkinsela sp. CCAP 1560/4]|eukprot:KNH05588.1 leucine rich repeat domain protein [Perkinsela sp. CCAP 1560/4]